MRKLSIIYIGMLLGLAAACGAAAEPLALDRALQLARQNSSGLRAARMSARAAEKAIAAAGLQVNPKIQFKGEDVSTESGDFGAGEYSIGISREFRRGSRRKARRILSQKAAAVALETQAAAERSLLARVRVAFFDVLAQQEAASIQADQQELGRAFVEVAERRYAAGAGSELEVAQAKLALQEIILAQACCLGELQAALEHLAALIGIPGKDLQKVSGSFFELEATEGLTLDGAHPELLRLDAKIEEVTARATLARSSDAGDLKLGAGVSHTTGPDENTLMFQVSMPLNWAGKGRLEQEAILLEVDAARARRAQVLRRLQAELASEVALHGGVSKEVQVIRDELIPMAERAYELSRSGYEAGRFSWYELIAAQQHLADIRIRFIDAFKEAHFIHASILSLTGEKS